MAEKSDYEKTFNEIFGTDIRWSKLAKEDLVQIATVLNNPDSFLKRLGLDNQTRRPVLDFLAKSIVPVIQNSPDAGVIPGLREKLKSLTPVSNPPST